jgi:hypothetical protein
MRQPFFISLIALTIINSHQTEQATGAETYDFKKARQHWSFKAPQRREAGKLKNPAWMTQPLDAFVLARLEDANLSPNPPADERMLKRRVSFDLTGLPPDSRQINGDSYEEFVEQLLASPHFGERWARLWLDVARFAEDQAHIVGNNASLTYPNAWMYRDWVIDALNKDLPYNEFLRRQLATDLILPDEKKEYPALGFMGLGPKYYRRGDLAVMADEWEDRIDTLTRGVLGLTVACARCHDHFYDPIPSDDYYALAGVFASTEMFNHPLEEKHQGDGRQSKKPADASHIVREAKSMRNLPVYERGDVKAPGKEVPRGFLTILGSNGKRLQFNPETSGRLDLAEALVSRDNPLTARVWVNRVWAELFGQPLVATPSNFGALGEKPTHPDLLDDLSVRFMEEGTWSLKWLIREIVLSSTYCQSSEAFPAKVAQDPGNELLWRMNRRRLSIEMWRDALYSASDTLDRAIGGRSFKASDPKANRRTVYASISRLQLDPLLALFDFPDPNLHSAGRVETTTPLQKLFLMNNPLVAKQAEAFAARIEKNADPANVKTVVNRAYEILFARTPKKEELALGQRFLENNELRDYAQALLNTNEFSWLD